MKTETIFAEYQFSESELKGLSIELARKVQEQQLLDDKRKSVVSQLKAELDAAQAEIVRLSNCVRNGSEFRNIQCEVDMDYENGIKRFIRLDNGDTVREVKLEADEYQTSFVDPQAH